MTEAEKQVCDAINDVLQQNELPKANLSVETNILQETALDSMGLAVVLVRLEDLTGKDPFAEGFVEFQTIGQLARLYEQ